MYKRIFLIVLDSVGIGEAPDAASYGDVGSNTIKSISTNPNFKGDTMESFGLFNVDGVDYHDDYPNPIGAYGKCTEKSNGKDTTTGHWEMMGIISEKPFPTFPDGFPAELIQEFSEKVGHPVLVNKPYSGTEVIKDYGEQAFNEKALIVYTSADSVFQIAAHVDAIPLNELYRCCEVAREMLKGDLNVGRVIARPFEGTPGNYTRTLDRKDYSVMPPKNVLNYLKEADKTVIAVGKISDIFAGSGVTAKISSHNNPQGMDGTMKMLEQDFEGLCFVNLVDFDMVYGHRNDVDGYAKAFAEFDAWLSTFKDSMRDDDLLLITADHGCDPATPSTDHSREYTPIIAYSKNIKPVNLGIRETFADIGKTITHNFNIGTDLPGTSFLKDIK
ncbi:MAG: phosphopentomutase [Bacilli bacterium]|nr:phosphopentomutase [Bacilli bacterium]